MSHPDGMEISRLLEALDPVDLATFRHLLECRLCRVRLRPGLNERWAAALGAEPSYDAIWERLEEKVRRAAETRVAEEATAADRLAELLALPEGEREYAISGDERFRSWALAGQLLEDGRRAGSADPAAGLERINLALALADRLRPAVAAGMAAGFQARAHCYLAESLALSGDLAGAEAAFQHAALHLEGSADPLDRAWFCHLLGQMRAEQGRRDEAAALAGRASILFARVGQGPEAAVAILCEVRLLLELGEPDLALEPVYRLLRMSRLGLLPVDLFDVPFGFPVVLEWLAGPLAASGVDRAVLERLLAELAGER
jgi:tetratricopeptide (TPR) repeat protein